jgi:hypothetical protein
MRDIRSALASRSAFPCTMLAFWVAIIMWIASQVAAISAESVVVSLGLYGGSRTQDGGNSGCISRELDTTRGRKRGLWGWIMKLRIWWWWWWWL